MLNNKHSFSLSAKGHTEERDDSIYTNRPTIPVGGSVQYGMTESLMVFDL
jgi:hypothetical protein